MTISVLTENHPQMWPRPCDFTGLGLLTTRLVPGGKPRPVDVGHVVCPQVPAVNVWRPTYPGGFFDLSESLISPLPIDDMVNLSDMICHMFQLTFWPGIHVWHLSDVHSIPCWIFGPFHLCISIHKCGTGSHTRHQLFSFSTLSFWKTKGFFLTHPSLRLKYPVARAHHTCYLPVDTDKARNILWIVYVRNCLENYWGPHDTQ